MMTTRWHTLLPSLGLGLTMVLALLALCSGAALPARADGPCTVCLEAGVCAYTTLQAAVDDGACNDIRVAQGVYTGVQGRPVPARYSFPPASGLITQVVYISRTVTVRGGYTATNWTTPYPLTQPTTLDAGGLGRALVVAGDISPTIEGLGLTNGNAAGLGGDDGWDTGGGVYIIRAAATLSACRVFSNTAEYGGGLGLWYSPATLSACHVFSNTAQAGGGLCLWYSPATLSANRVTSNTATFFGGGLDLYRSPATLISNSVTANTARRNGGGLGLHYSPATLISNSVTANTARRNGGGLFLEFSPAMLSANSVTSNTAGGGLYLDGSGATLSATSVTSNAAGGGLYLMYKSNAWLTNTVVADNRAGTNGSGLYVTSSSPRLVHTTIAHNGGGDGSGVYVAIKSSVWLTNTILVSHTVGITVAAGSTATLNSTLWYGNGADWDGAGTLTRTGDITGDPAFADPNGGDYHLTASSAAIEQGVAAGVTTGKDGHLRDAQPDLGAY